MDLPDPTGALAVLVHIQLNLTELYLFITMLLTVYGSEKKTRSSRLRLYFGCFQPLPWKSKNPDVA